MRKLKTLWRNALSPRVWEELETWFGVLLAVGAALLLYTTLKNQAAHAGSFATTGVMKIETMAAGARGTPWPEAYVHAVPAAGMPPVAALRRLS